MSVVVAVLERGNVREVREDRKVVKREERGLPQSQLMTPFASRIRSQPSM
jgi:hypothetical protein